MGADALGGLAQAPYPTPATLLRSASGRRL